MLREGLTKHVTTNLKNQQAASVPRVVCEDQCFSYCYIN